MGGHQWRGKRAHGGKSLAEIRKDMQKRNQFLEHPTKKQLLLPRHAALLKNGNPSSRAL
jgi:hypothetical protein